MENADVARVFDELADLLEIKGENAFRVRAYRNAARTLESLPTPVVRLLERGEDALCELPGIGQDLAGKIHALVLPSRRSPRRVHVSCPEEARRLPPR